jgi:hypothetical protein
LKKLLTDDGIIFFDFFLDKQLANKKILKKKNGIYEEFTIWKYLLESGNISRTLYQFDKNKKRYTDLIFVVEQNRRCRVIHEKMVRGIFSRKDVLNCIQKAGFEAVYCGKSYIKNGTAFIIRKK